VRVTGARRKLLDFVVQREINWADTLTIRLGATPSGLTSAHLHHPPYYGMETVQVTPLRRTLASSPYSKFASCLQGFDTVGWAAGSTSGPQKNMGGGGIQVLRKCYFSDGSERF